MNAQTSRATRAGGTAELLHCASTALSFLVIRYHHMSDILLSDVFPTDAPVRPREMIGRREDVNAVAGALSDGVHTIIAGPRRIGKTSVCEAALARLRRRGVYVAAVDLFEQADAGELAASLVAAVLANRPALRRLLPGVRSATRTLATAASATVAVKARVELGDEVEMAFRPAIAERHPDRALHGALQLPQRIAHADGRRIVLFLDEFQEIASPRAPYGDPDVLTRRLRSVLQRSPDVSVLFAGSIEHIMRDLFAPSDRALSQFGSFHELAPITVTEWVEGLGARFAVLGLDADEALRRGIVALADAHPRSTMLVARGAAETARREGAATLQAHHVELGLIAALASDRLRHQQQLERIRDLRHGQRIAERIARGEPVYAGLAPKMAASAVAGLRERGIIEQGARRGSWRVVDPLFARYLARLGQPRL